MAFGLNVKTQSKNTVEGRKIHNYQFLELIGEGGMGNVYLGRHLQLGNKVAIKALHLHLARNPGIRRRFKNEASTLSQLKHPNIVELIDYIDTQDEAFLIMEYVPGLPLDIYIKTQTGPIPEKEAIRLLSKVLDAVEYAHQKNIVHRDIKPSNIIITPEGNVKVLDFGIAKILGNNNNHRLTKTGSKVGTVLYMSPEQVEGNSTDYRTDIYSLGVTLFQMLTGKCPYPEDGSEYEVYYKIVNEPLPSAKEIFPAVSNKMQRIIEKATQKPKELRFQSCAELREAVVSRSFEDTSRKPHKAQKNKRRRWILSVLFIVILLATLSGIYYFYFLYESAYVLAFHLNLRSEPQLEAPVVEDLKYGDKLLIITDNTSANSDNYQWIMVRTTTGEKGYVARRFTGSETELRQINAIFGEYSELPKIPVIYKKALRLYFLENGHFSGVDNRPYWQLVHSKETGFQSYSFGDFDGNGITDFVCLLENDALRLKLLVMLNENHQNIHEIPDYSSKKVIQVIPAGEEGGKWFLGNVRRRHTVWGQRYEEKVYEFLPVDGLLLYDMSTDEQFLYLYNPQENMFFFVQQ